MIEMLQLEAFDMINKRFVAVDQRFSSDNINGLLELDNAGLKLKDEILIELFGQNYPQEAQIYYNQFLISQQEQYSSKQETEKILQKCQLMHVFKPLSYVDLYTTIEDNSLFIIDKDLNILQQTPINCEIYSGYKNEDYGRDIIIYEGFEIYPGYKNDEYYGDVIIIYEGFFHQLIPCKGVLYVQINEQVFQLKDSQLVVAFKIPEFIRHNVSSYYCCIFCFKDELYVKTSNKEFVYRNETFVQLREVEEWSFQNQQQVFSYEWNFEDGQHVNIFEITAENTKDQIFQVRDADYVPYMSNGIMIVQLQNHNSVIVDLLNYEMKDFTEDSTNMLQHIVLSESGLNLKQELIEKYFGAKIIKQQKQSYLELIEHQMQFPCYLEEIHKIIPFNLIFEQYKIQFKELFENKLSCFAELNQKVVQKQEKTNYLVNNQVQIQSRMVQSLKQFMECETDQ
ncbi:Conserved_hypothetical protein [Hexamita inflata]|uniref:Uncharacterized protein n=1 Tax=Hexamita inflata TaxID=28002 RepID=A0AA86Q9I9_9EUKA|nr:Conserved hypothetical protein [Hexamita inflata]